MQQQLNVIDEIVRALDDPNYGALDTDGVLFLQTPTFWCQLLPEPAESNDAGRVDIWITMMPLSGPLDVFAGAELTLTGSSSYTVQLDRFGRGTIYDVVRGHYQTQLVPSLVAMPGAFGRTASVVKAVAETATHASARVRKIVGQVRPTVGAFRIPEPGAVGYARGVIATPLTILGDHNKTTRQRAEAARELGHLGNLEAVPALIEHLGNDTENLEVRQATAVALGQLGDVRGQNALQAIRDDPERDPGLVDTVQRVLGRSVTPAVQLMRDEIVIQLMTPDAAWEGALGRLVWEPDNEEESGFERFVVLRPIRRRGVYSTVCALDADYDAKQLARGTFLVQGPYAVTEFLKEGSLAEELADTLLASVLIARSYETWEARLAELSQTKNQRFKQAIAGLDAAFTASQKETAGTEPTPKIREQR